MLIGGRGIYLDAFGMIITADGRDVYAIAIDYDLKDIVVIDHPRDCPKGYVTIRPTYSYPRGYNIIFIYEGDGVGLVIDATKETFEVVDMSQRRIFFDDNANAKNDRTCRIGGP